MHILHRFLRRSRCSSSGIALNELHLYGDPAAVSLIQRLLSVNANNVQVVKCVKDPLGCFSNSRTRDCIVTFVRDKISKLKVSLGSLLFVKLQEGPVSAAIHSSPVRVSILKYDNCAWFHGLLILYVVLGFVKRRLRLTNKVGASTNTVLSVESPSAEPKVHAIGSNESVEYMIKKGVWFEVELQGAQGDREAESGLSKVFWAEDTTRSTYQVNRSPSSAIRFKKPIDMLGFFGWLASIKQGMIEPVYVKCICLGYHKSIVGNKLWRLDDVTSNVVLYRNMGPNDSGEYKKTFIGSGVGTGSMQVLHGFEFEVEPLRDHTFELALDREQHLACELFGYKEDGNEAAFAVAAVEKIYAHELLTFNNTVASTVAGNVLTTTIAKTEGIHQATKGLVDKEKGNVLGMQIVKDQSGYTLRVSQSRFYNEKLVQNLLEGYSILSFKGILSGDCDVEKNDKRTCFVDFDYARGGSTTVMSRSITGYGLMRLGCAGCLKANLQHMKALSTIEAGYMTFTKAWKKEIWLKGLLAES
nr:zinc finger, CCHC-type [Tanacetum cinerariifolium]